MENKNVIRTFCCCKLILNLIRVLPVYLKKYRGTGWTPTYTKYQKIKRWINCGENCSINTRLNLKSRFAWEKKKNTISEIFFIKQAQAFVQLIVFWTPLPIFVSWYSSKEELARMLIHFRKIFNCKVSLKCRCQCAL